MKRVLLDTSVYGELITGALARDTSAKLVPGHYVIYGTKTIRNELRDVAKEARTNDGKSMLSEHALPACKAICQEFGLHIPAFITYKGFKEMIAHG
ncbi:MAG: hypothetical protein HYY37_03490 [Candidatus Aenigmarchaeota archaeon]|nr:hypothetical protein [Candidatus Aenigmarchaeota archaeon]